jgi:hypothetical protein
MKSKKILRLEAEMCFNSLPLNIQEKIFDSDQMLTMNQEQANWRVVLFRDEIMELEEYTEWLTTPEALIEEDHEYDYAN